MEQASKPDWAEDSQVFMHDQYQALKDFLIHAEDVRQRHINLYFTFLVAVFGVLAAVRIGVPLNVGQSRAIYVGTALTILVIGSYTYFEVLYSHGAAFMFMAELDSMTFRWVRQRPDDAPYYHLRSLVESILCPTSKQGRPLQRPRWRMLRATLTLLGCPAVWLRKATRQRQLFLVTFVNSASLGFILWELANPPQPMTFLSGFLGCPLGRWVPIAFVSGFAWILQVFFYMRQYHVLLTLAADKLRKAKA